MYSRLSHAFHAVCQVVWSGREDLNLRHPAPKAGALPGCATPRLNDFQHLQVTEPHQNREVLLAC